MLKRNWKVYTFWIVLCEAVGLLSGLLSTEGITAYNSMVIKPPFTPTAWVFPVVWTILFALMGISAARITLSEPSTARSRGLNLFIAQLVVNFFWPLFFFNLQAFGFALFWLLLLWILVLLTILQFWQVDQTAAWLLTPYLAWLTFAAVLNAAVWVANL
jgi:tryptophan-rich sensory protein